MKTKNFQNHSSLQLNHHNRTQQIHINWIMNIDPELEKALKEDEEVDVDVKKHNFIMMVIATGIARNSIMN